MIDDGIQSIFVITLFYCMLVERAAQGGKSICHDGGGAALLVSSSHWNSW